MTLPAPEPIKIGRARRKCSHCRQHGHDVRHCPELAEPKPEPDCSCSARDNPGMICICAMRGIVIERRAPGGPDELIDECARLREVIDGLELEIADWDRLRLELEKRIASNKERAIVAKAELAILRSRRPR